MTKTETLLQGSLQSDLNFHLSILIINMFHDAQPAQSKTRGAMTPHNATMSRSGGQTCRQLVTKVGPVSHAGQIETALVGNTLERCPAEMLLAAQRCQFQQCPRDPSCAVRETCQGCRGDGWH